MRQRDSHLLLLAYVGLALGLSAGHIATPDGHLRLALARRLYEQHILEVPADVGNPGHGNVAILPSGRRYVVYGPGQTLLFLPLVALAQQLSPYVPLDTHYIAAFFASFLGPLCHALIAWVLFGTLACLGLEKRDALIGSLVYFGASVALPHSQDGYDHIEEGLAVLLALRFAIQARSGISPSRSAWLAGTALGIGLMFRLPAGLALPGILLVLASTRLVPNVLAGMFPWIVMVGIYNWVRFGSPLETGYPYAWPHSQPVAPGAGGFFSTPIFEGASGLWLSSGKGMIVYSPALLGALLGWPAFVRRQPNTAGAALLTLALYTAVYGTNWAWHGSPWCWGPRYLIPIVPLCFLGWPGWQRLYPLVKVFVAGVVALSVVLQLLALSIDYRRGLLMLYVRDSEAFVDGRVLYDWPYSPLFLQSRAVADALKGISAGRQLDLFLPMGPWRNEERPASLEQMIHLSVDLNSVNLWWLRMAYLPVPKSVAVASLPIGFVLLGGGLFGIWRVWRRTGDISSKRP